MGLGVKINGNTSRNQVFPLGMSTETLRYDLLNVLVANSVLTNDGVNVQVRDALLAVVVALKADGDPSDFIEGINFASATEPDVLNDADSNALCQIDTLNDDEWLFTPDNGVANSYLRIGNVLNEMFAGVGKDSTIFGRGIIGFAAGIQDFLQNGFGASFKTMDNSAGATGASNIIKAASFVANQQGVINVNVSNSPLIGGNGQIAKTSNQPYFSRLAFNVGGAFDIEFVPDTPTADRVVTQPDAEGENAVMNADVAADGDTLVYDTILNQPKRYATERVINSGQVIIAAATTLSVAVFVRNASERLKAPSVFITDNVAGAQINQRSNTGVAAATDEVFVWWERNVAADSVSLKMHNNNAAASRTVDWLIEGIIP